MSQEQEEEQQSPPNFILQKRPTGFYVGRVCIPEASDGNFPTLEDPGPNVEGFAFGVVQPKTLNWPPFALECRIRSATHAMSTGFGKDC